MRRKERKGDCEKKKEERKNDLMVGVAWKGEGDKAKKKSYIYTQLQSFDDFD